MFARLNRGIARGAERWRKYLGYGLDRLGAGGLDNGPAWRKRTKLPEAAIICGSAPSLLSEFHEARARRANAYVIAINDAARLVRADMIFTQHPETAMRFLAGSKNKNAEVHMGKYRYFARGNPISVYWPDCVQGVTSGGSAIHVACMMHFSEIILCGLPMQGGSGYATGLGATTGEPRFGLEASDSQYVKAYCRRFEHFVTGHRRLLAPVRSCGGWTRELFGAPDWLD